MTTASRTPYALGSSDAEQERLIRQAVHLAPFTERFFRDAGIGLGQRVLDLGSGVGDVSLLLSRIVGPSGEVIGVERDARSVARATARVADAGIRNVTFIERDVTQLSKARDFDAAVGRFILMFLPDPVHVLRCLRESVRPDGVLAFHEPSYAAFLLLSAHLPLWSAGLSVIHETLRRSGVNTDMGLALYRVFQEAGLPAPNMRMEMPLGNDSDFTSWVYDVLCSLKPKIQQLGLPLEELGDFETLGGRIQAEVAKSKGVVPWQALVGAWSRNPQD